MLLRYTQFFYKNVPSIPFVVEMIAWRRLISPTLALTSFLRLLLFCDDGLELDHCKGEKALNNLYQLKKGF